LYSDAFLSEQYTLSLKKGKEKEEMKECSFEPKIDKIRFADFFVYSLYFFQ
jgi:hypothetical protein